MNKRFAPVMLMLLVLSLVLAACGSTDAKIPSYSGAKTITLSDQARKSLSLDQTGVKDAKVEAYTTSDDATKVKSFFMDQLKKDGWSDSASEIKGFGDSAKQIESVGGFAFFYGKGDKGVAYIGFPGSFASLLNIPDVNDKDTLYIVISGKK